MWIENNFVSVKENKWAQDTLDINYGSLAVNLPDTYDEVSDKLLKVINTINSINMFDLVLKEGFISDTKLEDWWDELKVMKLISNKLNKVIEDYISNDDMTCETLKANLDSISSQVKLSLKQQWYYNEFVSIINWANPKTLVGWTMAAIRNNQDELSNVMASL